MSHNLLLFICLGVLLFGCISEEKCEDPNADKKIQVYINWEQTPYSPEEMVVVFFPTDKNTHITHDLQSQGNAVLLSDGTYNAIACNKNQPNITFSRSNTAISALIKLKQIALSTEPISEMVVEQPDKLYVASHDKITVKQGSTIPTVYFTPALRTLILHFVLDITPTDPSTINQIRGLVTTLPKTKELISDQTGNEEFVSVLFQGEVRNKLVYITINALGNTLPTGIPEAKHLLRVQFFLNNGTTKGFRRDVTQMIAEKIGTTLASYPPEGYTFYLNNIQLLEESGFGADVNDWDDEETVILSTDKRISI